MSVVRQCGVGHKGFDIYPARDTLEEAEAMREMLCQALGRLCQGAA